MSDQCCNCSYFTESRMICPESGKFILEEENPACVLYREKQLTLEELKVMDQGTAHLF